MSTDSEALVMLVTAPPDRACELGTTLVDERLAACPEMLAPSVESGAPQHVQFIRDAVLAEGR